jgi:hypothetical protein
MQKSKLIQLIQKLSSRELSRFEDFVYSPYYNKHEQVRDLCSYLIQLAPKWDHPRRLQKEYVFKKIFPTQKFDKGLLNRTASALLQLLHDFLVQERLQHEKMQLEQQLILLEELRKLKADKDYKSSLQKYHKTQEKTAEGTSEAFLNKYKLHKELDRLFIDKGGRQFDENLQLKNYYFDAYFVVEKLRIACDMINRNNIIRSDYQTTMIEELLEYAKREELAKIPAIQIYKAILRMLGAENEAAEKEYIKLKILLEEHYKGVKENNKKEEGNKAGFTNAELMSIYDYILNFCAKQINQGKSEYYQEMLDAYRFLIESQVIFIDGYLAAWDYKNTVTVALRVEDFDWAIDFIETKKQYLPPSVKDNVYRYNLSAYKYAVKDYGAALQALHNIEFTDASYFIGAKTIQIKSYYELNEEEALTSLIESFSTYLRRNKKISDYWKSSNLNFLKLANRIRKLKTQKDYMPKHAYQAQWNKIQVLLEDTSPLANKDWLMQAMNNLKEI